MKLTLSQIKLNISYHLSDGTHRHTYTPQTQRPNNKTESVCLLFGFCSFSTSIFHFAPANCMYSLLGGICEFFYSNVSSSLSRTATTTAASPSAVRAFPFETNLCCSAVRIFRARHAELLAETHSHSFHSAMHSEFMFRYVAIFHFIRLSSSNPPK